LKDEDKQFIKHLRVSQKYEEKNFLNMFHCSELNHLGAKDVDRRSVSEWVQIVKSFFLESDQYVSRWGRRAKRHLGGL